MAAEVFSLSRTLADGTVLHHRPGALEFASLFEREPSLPIERWIALGQAKVVKQGPHRIVWHVELPSVSFHLKKNLIPNWRARMRGWMRGPKARREFGLIEAVQERGIPTSQALAWAERGGESYLFTRTLENVEPLHLYFLRTFQSHDAAAQTPLRQSIARALGSLIAAMHRAGVEHRDLHAGNLLVRMEGETPRLFLIDLDAVALVRPLEGERRLANLAMLNAWFRLHTERTDRLRFWKSYAEANPLLPWKKFGHDAVSLANELEQRSAEYSLALWRGRESRCLGNNRYYQRLSAGATHSHAVRGLDESLLATQRWNARPADESFEPTEADEGRCRWTAIVDTGSTKAAWKASQAFRERGLPTAETLAAVIRNDGLGGQLLTTTLPKSRLLSALLRTASLADRRYWIRRLADAFRDLHDRGVLWPAPDFESIAVVPDGDAWIYPNPPSLFPRVRNGLWFVDLTRMRLQTHIGESDRQRDLACLAAEASRSDQLRFLRRYLRWGLKPKEGWKAWWRQIAETLNSIENPRRLSLGGTGAVPAA
ncbi:MAG: lipopolysaccharide kinase InaA family protein [Gemmataceae bacterium]|nr:lipopolysaccharide kinase InaA family protein [Gemmataceae bacterium]